MVQRIRNFHEMVPGYTQGWADFLTKNSGINKISIACEWLPNMHYALPWMETLHTTHELPARTRHKRGPTGPGLLTTPGTHFDRNSFNQQSANQRSVANCDRITSCSSNKWLHLAAVVPASRPACSSAPGFRCA
jgi:hypothetical protein